MIGIHPHNDSELAVANALAAVEAGATLVQGCINGYGERCGNAALSSVIAGLELKMGQFNRRSRETPESVRPLRIHRRCRQPAAPQ